MINQMCDREKSELKLIEESMPDVGSHIINSGAFEAILSAEHYVAELGA
jgi:hypothetical protein